MQFNQLRGFFVAQDVVFSDTSLIPRIINYRDHNMIHGLLQLLLFQALGEVLSKFLMPFIPGPVIGLVALLAFLVWRGSVPRNIDLVGGAMLGHLGLLFIPASVGVVMFLPLLQQNLLAVAVALILSVVSTVAVTALVLKVLAPNRPQDEHAP